MKKILFLVPLCFLLACGDPVVVGTELPGGFVVRERSPMVSLEVCAARAQQMSKGDAVAEKIDEHYFIYNSILNSGQRLLQLCQYRKGEVTYIMAVSREASFPMP